MTGGSNRPGIALIEVLISVALIGVGLVTIVRALDVCVRTVSRSGETNIATVLLDEAILEVTQVQPMESHSSQSGRFEAPYEKFYWDAQSGFIEDTSFLEITVNVRWTDSKREHKVTARRIVLR